MARFGPISTSDWLENFQWIFSEHRESGPSHLCATNTVQRRRNDNGVKQICETEPDHSNYTQ